MTETPRQARLSARLQEVVDALPLRPGLRVLEVGGAPGAAAREVAHRIRPNGHVLVIDRSAKGVALINKLAQEEIGAGLLGVRQVAVEDLALEHGERPYDLAFACRVGALDGRHPEVQERAVANLRAMLTPSGMIFVDGKLLRKPT